MATIRLPPKGLGSRASLVRPFSVSEFDQKRNRVLILRQTGGLGDILMHRMLFEDFKILAPDIKIVFGVPAYYIPALIDHPFIDEVVDCNSVDARDFIISYVTTTSCGRYENKIAPLADKHRSDIWADTCGIPLTKHEMHFRLTSQEIAFGKEALNKYRNGKSVFLLAPISAMESKNLNPEQMNGVAKKLQEMGMSVVTIHNTPIPEMKEAPVLSIGDIRQWMGVINAADAVVSVDTGTFHCAGGMKKPLIGIFTWADGLAYGKWFDFVLIQKHRHFTPGWGCGPCYKWHDCPKCPLRDTRKPCITSITVDDIMAGVSAMFSRWPQLRPERMTVSPASSDAVALVRAADSVTERLASVELPVVQAIC